MVKTADNGQAEVGIMLEEIQLKAFAYETDTIPALLTDLMTAILEQQLIDFKDARRLQIFNRIMQASMEAIQNRDYLLLADLMKYELTKLLGIDGMEKILQ